MKPFTRWALAIISIAVVVTALLLAQEGNFIRKLRDYCNPTAQEAEWLAAFQEVSDEDVVVLHYDNTVMVGTRPVAYKALRSPRRHVLACRDMGKWDHTAPRKGNKHVTLGPP